MAKPLPALFAVLDEGRRCELRALGWADVLPEGAPRLWKRPDDGALLDEHEAFLWLERHKKAMTPKEVAGAGPEEEKA